jgi:inosose dehydratase
MGKAKFAYTVWQWGVENRQQFVQALKDVTAAGYEYFESVKAAIDVFGDDVAGFKALCDEYGAQPNGFYFHLTGDWDNDVEDVRRKLPFMAECGIHRMNVQATGSTGTKATRAELEYDLRAIDAIAEMVKKCDILPCLHPHHNTTVMYEDEIDFIMENTDPALVAFGPDTAHLVAGGCDPVQVIAKYAGRVKFIHLKDIVGGSAESAGYRAGVEVYTNFRELGEGGIDFPSIFKILDDAGYDGFLTAELDISRFGHRESAAITMAYLKAHYRRDGAEDA